MRISTGNPKLTRKPEGRHAINQAEVNGFRVATLFARHLFQWQTENFSGGRAVNVFALRERVNQTCVVGQMRHNAQLNLGIVGGNNFIAITGNKGLPNSAPFLVTNRNILQIRITGRKPPGCRHGLMVRGVHAPGLWVHHLRQFVGVSGFQFAQATMLHQHFWQFVAVRQFFQHFFIGGWRAFRGFLQHRQAEFIKQNFLQLFRGCQIERLSRQFVRLHFKCGQSFGNFVGLQEQRIRINQHATTLHA